MTAVALGLQAGLIAGGGRNELARVSVLGAEGAHDEQPRARKK